MKDQARFNTYDEMVKELDQQREAELAAQEEISGNQAQVYSEVAKRSVAQRDYEKKRQTLIELREDARGVSEGVEAFLKKDEPVSKFDLDSGKEQLDTSLQPLGGKKL